MPLARRTGETRRGVDAASRSIGADDRRPLRRVGHERRRARRLPRPSRRGSPTTRRDRDATSSSPPFSSIQRSCWSSRNSVASAGVLYVWSSAAVLERDARGRATPGTSVPRPRSARCARGRRASTPRARGRRRRRSTSAARSSRRRPRSGRPAQPAGRRGGVDDDERRRRPPGARGGIITPVDVSLWVSAYTSTSASATGAGCVPGSLSITTGCVEVRRGRRGGGELRRELAEDEVLAPPLDQAERGDVPERGRAAVAEQRPPSRRAGRTARRAPSRSAPTTTLHRRLAMATCRGSSGAASASASHRLGRAPSTGRNRSGRRAGSRAVGDRNVAASGRRRSLCQHGQPWSRDLPTRIAAHRRVGHAGRRRQGQGAEGGR